MPFMLSAVVDFNLHDSRTAVTQFLSRIAPLLNCPIAEHAVVDLTRCRYLGPDGAALLAATWLARREMGDQLTVLLPTDPDELLAFCSFSGLNQLIHGGAAPNPKHPDCEKKGRFRLDR